MTVTLAGHPPPLRIGRDGAIEQVGAIGTLLGAIDPLKIEEVEVRLDERETLLLYTDGVIDAGTGGAALGERGLIELCAGAGELTLAQLLTRLEQAAIGRSEGELHDDLALLAVRLGPADLAGQRSAVT
jgi:serine phosphatase RsbU (regulator of sigma subunit)